MNEYRVSFEVKDVGSIEFDVPEKTYNEISKFCKEEFPEIEWKTFHD